MSYVITKQQGTEYLIWKTYTNTGRVIVQWSDQSKEFISSNAADNFIINDLKSYEVPTFGAARK